MSDDIPHCPVLHPTMKDFNNFHDYMLKLETMYSNHYGIVKVVPPKGWKARTKDYTKSLETAMIPSPIEQNVFGKGGIYECLHIIKKSMNFRDYQKRSADFDRITEGKSEEEVEQMFLKNISFSPPVYGSDFMYTLFDDGVLWNLANLPSILNDGLTDVIQGVNKPYLYVGSWKTMFAWHKEDMDLGAINYLHYGKTKFWYAIARDDQHYLEKMAKSYFADNFAKCNQFLRHKTTIINPYLLKKQFPQIRVHKMRQEAGEFIVVFPGSYHHGFNYGFNIAEAVNYATVKWLPMFMEAKSCRCISDMVKIHKKEFYENLIKNRPDLVKNQFVIAFKKAIEYEEQAEKAKQLQKDAAAKPRKGAGSKSASTKKGAPAKSQSTVADEDDSDDEDDHNKVTPPLPIGRKAIKKAPASKAATGSGKKSNPSSPKLDSRTQSHAGTPVKEKTRGRPQGKGNAASAAAAPVVVQIDTWVQCDKCSKWRRVTEQSLGKKVKKNQDFYCNMLPGMTCRKAEEDHNSYQQLGISKV